MLTVRGLLIPNKKAMRTMIRSAASYSLMLSALVACSSTAGVEEEDLARELQGIERTELKILDHNLGGGDHNNGVDGLNAIQDQIDDKFKPDIVLLQEVCTAQFNRLHDKYAPKSWGVEFQATREKHPKCKDQPKGMVIMSRHGLNNRTVHPLPEPDGEITPSLFCVSVTRPGVPADRIRACTSHFRAGKEPVDDVARKAQGQAAADAVAAEIKDLHRLVIITGDLNSQPTDPPVTPLYGIGNGKGLFYEADQTDTDYCKSGECRGGGPTFYKKKIDFVFLSKNRATGTLSLGTEHSNTSDHRMVRVVAKVDLKTSDGVSKRLSTVPGMPNDPPNDPDAQSAPVLPEEQPTEPISETEPDPGPETPPTEQPPPSACDNDCWRAALTPWLTYEAPAMIRDDRHVGRRAFDPRFYLSLYADVRANGGENNHDYAEYHWLKNGIKEGRMGSPLFDAPYYLAVYPDVAAAVGATNYLGALDHYLDHGVAEGRRGSVVFDASYYLSRYGDLATAFGGGNFAAALDHFQQKGLSEGRQASADFAPAWYLGTNPDIQAAVGATDFRAGLRHYILYGRPEGRHGAP